MLAGKRGPSPSDFCGGPLARGTPAAMKSGVRARRPRRGQRRRRGTTPTEVKRQGQLNLSRLLEACQRSSRSSLVGTQGVTPVVASQAEIGVDRSTRCTRDGFGNTWRVAMTTDDAPSPEDFEAAARVLQSDMNHRMRCAIGDQRHRLDELGGERGTPRAGRSSGRGPTIRVRTFCGPPARLRPCGRPGSTITHGDLTEVGSGVQLDKPTNDAVDKRPAHRHPREPQDPTIRR